MLARLLLIINLCLHNIIADNISDIIDKSETNDNLIDRIDVLEHKILQLERIVNKISLYSQNQDQQQIESATIDTNQNQNPQVTTNKAPQTPEKREYDHALSVLKDGNHAQAGNLFADFIDTYPNSELLSNAYFWHGESFFRQKFYEKAALNYLKGYKKSPQGQKAADSLLKLAFSLSEIQKNKEACATLEKLKTEFPTRPQLSMKKAAELEKKLSCQAPNTKTQNTKTKNHKTK